MMRQNEAELGLDYIWDRSGTKSRLD